MNISQIKIRRLYDEGRMKALVSVTIDDDFAVHDIKVIEGPQRVFVAMPSRKEDGGNFRDVVHPITKEARDYMEKAILDQYYMALDENHQQNIPNQM
ncbi:MAG: septation regulator SpoVG [Oscillospiraceae bacterium]|nr:septation regulator SpoVG [Oscillospiraceae bacterium]